MKPSRLQRGTQADVDAFALMRKGGRMKCLRCNGTGKERKRPNLPVKPCYWCEGTGIEPTERRLG